MNALQIAQTALEEAARNTPEHSNWWMQQAIGYAAVAQAEQLKRLADAAEQRNVLLKEYNKEAEARAQRRAERTEKSMSKFVDALYGNTEEQS